MTYKVTGLVLLMCLVSAVSLGSTDGMKAMGLLPGNESTHPDTSAPDAWGYTWVKSTDPGGPTFNWVDITTRGTLVTGLTDDNESALINILFNFPYYWYTVNRFRVGSNGYIQFGTTTTSFAPPFAPIPSTSVPNDMLAICVGDLVFSGQTGAGGQCYYYTNGVDSLVVSFINVTEWEQTIIPTNIHTFQVILNKADSSITYQYGRQVGRYNSTNNTRLVIGMENSTGQIGLQYAYSTTPPHALMPDTGLAIKMKRTVNTGLAITDAGIVGGLNASNIGEMVVAGVAKTIQCVVKNYGTTTITNAPVRYAITRTGQPSAFDTVIVPSMQPGDQVTVTFPRQFTAAVTGSYSALFNITVPNDVGPGNNSKTAEIVSGTYSLSQNTVIQYEGGTVGGSINWIGGGGMGVAFEVPASVYPVRIESVYVSVASVTAQPMLVQILDGSTGSPGAVLAERTNVTAIVGMNGVDFRSDSIRIPGGKFFVGARGQMAFNYELTAPISYRSWEYTGGWAPYRSGDLQDVIIRVSVRQENPPITPGWTNQTSGITTYLYSIKAVSQTVAWAAGAGGRVLRTVNGGNTWTSVGGGNIGTADIYNIDAISASTAFVTTSPAATYIFRTTNGGTSWDTVFTQPGGFINAIRMVDATNGFATGDPVGNWTVLKTTNGGASWARIATEPAAIGTETGTQNGLSVVGANHIWFNSGQGGRIYRSTDGGATWSTGIAPFTATSNVWFNDAQYGVATSSSSNAVARSTDGGATWSSVTVAGSGFLIACGGAGTDDFWYARGTSIYRSTDRGATFASAFTGTGTYVGLSFVGYGSGVSGWGCTSTGGIAGFYGSLTGVDGQQGEVPAVFALMQNYPNPFNPSTSIRYALPQAAHVAVRIYNLLGQEIALLKDEVQTAGAYDVVWHGKNSSGQSVASGVYLYRLEATPVNGGATFNSFKKMVLVK